jgi:hypothetical protein
MNIEKIEIESTELFRNENSNFPDYQKAVAFTDESKYPKELQITVGPKGEIPSILNKGYYKMSVESEISNFKNLRHRTVYTPIKNN